MPRAICLTCPSSRSNTSARATTFGTTTSGTADHSVMDTGNGLGIKSANVPSSKGINFVKDDMTTIKDNTIKDCDNWRSSVQKALDKLSAKTNGTTIR